MGIKTINVLGKDNVLVASIGLEKVSVANEYKVIILMEDDTESELKDGDFLQ